MAVSDVFLFNSQIKKPIIIFGTGVNAKRAYFTLLNIGIEIQGFSDRKKELVGKKIFGKEIIYEDNLKGEEFSVIIASNAWQEISERLKDKGIETLYVMNMYGENDRGIEI